MHKIIFAVTSDLCYDQRMQRSAALLTAAGYKVLLIGRRKPGSKALLPELYEQTRLRCLFTKGKFFYAEYNIRLFFYLLFCRKAGAVCAVDTDTLPAVFAACRLKGSIPVLDAHEYFTQVPELVNRPRTRRIWEFIETLIIPRLRHCYTVSASYAVIFKRRYGVTFKVVRNVPPLLPPAKPAPWPGITGPYLIYIGVVNEGRGLEEAVQAMRRLPCQLLICGEGDVSDKIRAQIKAARLTDRVIMAGFVEPPLLRRLTAGAVAGLLLLRNTSPSYYYSLANKFFDYMHAGIPQLCAPFPEYKVINAQRQVALFAELNPDDIVTQALRLLTDEALQSRLRRNALALSKEYNAAREGKTLVEFWDRVFYGSGAVRGTENPDEGEEQG